MTIDKFSKLGYFNPEIKFGPINFYKRSPPGILGSRYDLLSQINYHKYLQSMDKSMCQWINQSINKSIYKCPKTP
jgi:hypothetical protein